MAEYTLVADRSGDVTMSSADKAARYAEIAAQLDAVLDGEEDLLACMTSVVCLLHNAFPYYYWTGFYRRVSADELLIGPYQGTLGCLRIRIPGGVCGTAAHERRTIVVPDVERFPGHIACDPRSASEIVVPVLDADGEAIAVLDVDSDVKEAFGDVDRVNLEKVVAMLSARHALPVVRSHGDITQ